MTGMFKTADYSLVTVEGQLKAAVKVLVPMDKIPEAERSARARIEAALPRLETGIAREGLKLAGINWQIYRKDCSEDRTKPETALHALLA